MTELQIAWAQAFMSLRFQLTEPQRRQLRAQLRSTGDLAVYRRTLALLELDQGRPVADVARALGVSGSSVYHWLDTFRKAPHAGALETRPGHGRTSLWTAHLEALLQEALRQSPGACGLPASCWTVPLLQVHLQRRGGRRLAAITIRRKLRQSGFVWTPDGYFRKQASD